MIGRKLAWFTGLIIVLAVVYNNFKSRIIGRFRIFDLEKHKYEKNSKHTTPEIAPDQCSVIRRMIDVDTEERLYILCSPHKTPTPRLEVVDEIGMADFDEVKDE